MEKLIGTLSGVGGVSGFLAGSGGLSGDLSAPSSRTMTLQEKTHIPPTPYSQTVEPDEGFDGLSSVQIDAIAPATEYTLGCIIVGEDLQITPEGVLSVQKATSVEADNTRPITSAAVYTEVGNINALLATI